MSTSRSRTGEHRQRQLTSPLAAVGAARGAGQNPEGPQFGVHSKWAVVASIGSAAVIAFVSVVGSCQVDDAR